MTKVLSDRRYPNWCCQKCGVEIGYVGRVFMALGIVLHNCKPPVVWKVDRDGRVVTDKQARKVVLRAKPKPEQL